MPSAWHVRFGRAIVNQILEAVDDRLGTSSSQGIDVRIAGKRFSGANLAQVAGEEEAPASLFDRLPDGLRREDDEAGTLRFDSQKVATADLITGNSFLLTNDTREGGFISLWGQGALTHFSEREDEFALEGEVASAMVGAGWTQGARSTGLIISHSRGKGTHSTTAGQPRYRGLAHRCLPLRPIFGQRAAHPMGRHRLWRGHADVYGGGPGTGRDGSQAGDGSGRPPRRVADARGERRRGGRAEVGRDVRENRRGGAARSALGCGRKRHAIRARS